MSFAVWDFIFQPFLFQIRSSGGFYLCRTNLHRSLTPLQQALFCAPLVSFPYPVPKTAHRAAQGRVRFFSPEGAPPPKGGGAGFCSSLGFRVLLGSCLWQPLATTGSHGPNRAGLLLRWCRSPTQSPDRPQIAAQGRVWFLPACWRISGGSPSLSAIPYKNSGRRKKYLCPTFLKWNQLSPSSHASVSSNPVG